MSLRKVQDIKIEKNPSQHTDEKLTHPAFGQIGVYRSSVSNFGNGPHGMPLYGSDFLHGNVVTVEIKESEQHRGLSSDRHHAGRTIAKVVLSEAQWATFVSSFNNGDGVPCTIEARDTDYMVPGLPPPRDRLAQFKGEVSETVKDSIKHIEGMIDRVQKMGLPQKKTAEIVDSLERAKQEIEDNLPFVAKQFGEHVEETVERAKVEINAYALGTLQRAGLAALTGGTPPPLPITLEPGADDHAMDTKEK